MAGSLKQSLLGMYGISMKRPKWIIKKKQTEKSIVIREKNLLLARKWEIIELEAMDPEKIELRMGTTRTF